MPVQKLHVNIFLIFLKSETRDYFCIKDYFVAQQATYMITYIHLDVCHCFSLLMYYYWLRGQGYKKTEEILQNQLKMVCFNFEMILPCNFGLIGKWITDSILYLQKV